MIKRIPPDRCMSAHAAATSVYSQDIIEHCGRLFESAYELDALARPDHSGPDTQLVRKSHLWVAQASTVKELAHVAQTVARLRYNIDKLTQGEFG